MLKKTITYDDLDGNPVTEDFYFNYSTAELAEMQMVADPEGGLESRLKRIIESNDPKQIMGEFKAIIGGAIGRRSEDGKRFIKNDQISQEFMASEAYSELFMEFLTNPASATSFINGLMPKKLQEQAAALGNETVVELPNSGVIEGVVGDAEAQASKPQPQFEKATPFPQSLEAAVQSNPRPNGTVQEDDDPPWLKEGRSPTRQEMMKMTQEELRFAFKMKEAGILSK